MNNFHFIFEKGMDTFDEVVEIFGFIGVAIGILVLIVVFGIPAIIIGLIKHRGWQHSIKQYEEFDEGAGGTVRHIWCTRCRLSSYERINFTR